MRYRFITFACIFLFMCGIIFLVFFYGPLRRSYITPGRVEQAFTAADIDMFWETSGVRGRTAILLTRHLNSEESPKDTNGVKFADVAMKHGKVRTIYHVVPDNSWDVVSDHVSPRKNARSTPAGFVLITPEGRVNIMPLSRFTAVNEKSLVVFEPGVWNSEERSRIASMISSGDISTDLLAIIRGTTADIDYYKSILVSSNR